ncbi:PADRE domain [Dillenia turbinata]|uniref:PADRE domain n=2 Tax=Dillenia turbinata TaxID=194707 RepID=A0AAN8VN76_9MAGN
MKEGAMKNTIRCCIACILPCGSLDVIRIVHSNGRVEEISGTIRASEIMKAYPKHVLKKPSSPTSSSDDSVVPKIMIVPPDAELQRGKIYFLMPAPTAPDKTRSSKKKKKRSSSLSELPSENIANSNNVSSNSVNNNSLSMSNFLISDRYLSDILHEKIATQRDRRRGRVGVWRPHLESISESPTDL